MNTTKYKALTTCNFSGTVPRRESFSSRARGRRHSRSWRGRGKEPGSKGGPQGLVSEQHGRVSASNNPVPTWLGKNEGKFSHVESLWQGVGQQSQRESEASPPNRVKREGRGHCNYDNNVSVSSDHPKECLKMRVFES